MKVELDNQELNIILQAMNSVTIKGKDAMGYAKILTKIEKAFKVEHEKAVKAEKDNG